MFTKHPGWYLGVKIFTPSQNNGLESTKNVLKKENTLRERLPMHEMLCVCNEVVFNWSRSRDPNK